MRHLFICEIITIFYIPNEDNPENGWGADGGRGEQATGSSEAFPLNLGRSRPLREKPRLDIRELIEGGTQP